MINREFLLFQKIEDKRRFILLTISPSSLVCSCVPQTEARLASSGPFSALGCGASQPPEIAVKKPVVISRRDAVVSVAGFIILTPLFVLQLKRFKKRVFSECFVEVLVESFHPLFLRGTQRFHLLPSVPTAPCERSQRCSSRGDRFVHLGDLVKWVG